MTGLDLARVKALATDYDRTLTDPDLKLEDGTVRALKDARERGLKVIVISGRELDYLVHALHGAVDAFVAENGCFMAFPHETDEAADVQDTGEIIARYRKSPVFDEPFRVREVLEGAGIDFEWGEALASCHVEDEPEVRELLKAQDVNYVRNRDRVMLLPPGIDKATGLEATVRTMGLKMTDVAAAGDGENDLVMMEAAGHAVAVANALPEVKDVADHVTDAAGGRGLAQWLDAWTRAQDGVEVPLRARRRGT